MAGDLDERELTISGVKLVFPCKPYPSQFGMMDRVIKGLERRQNCLLESPTGSGKSLALLCSALAWQNSQHLKMAKDAVSAAKRDSMEGESCKACNCEGETKNINQDGCCQQEKEKTEIIDVPGCTINLDEDDDDFKVPSRYRTPKLGETKPRKRSHVPISYEGASPSSQEKPCEPCTCNQASPGTSGKQKVPKIYFGTRTHKQIAQIIRELRRTAYHDVRMAILASREYTCVHPEVVRTKNKSEGCRERLDINGPGCTFNDKAKRVFLSQGQLQSELNTAWDIEELVHACKGKKACPYFVTKNIKDQADIIFCPYNYLIDPLVRKSMDINLKEQVVILDEAHNIEDCARDAASGQMSTSQISQALIHLQEMMDANVKFSEHMLLKRMMENVMKFVDDNSNHLDQADYDTSYKVWSGFDMVARLKNIGLGPDTIGEYKSCLESLAMSDEEPLQKNMMKNFRNGRGNSEPRLPSSSLKLLELLLQILDYMYKDNLKFVEDYRVAVMKAVEYVSRNNTNDSWLGKNRRSKSREVVFTLNFWCMNPAVAFSDFDECRNVVLSSGTLSPMNSFASELGVAFPIQLEANHVIKDEQVWVGSIGSGPTGSQLQAVYKNMETFTFQDELGNLILQVCQKVPHGVLCFLPSYRALEKFTERWKLTKIWEKLSLRKKIMVEPRAADREDFDYMMKMFYIYVKEPTYYDDDDEDCCDTSERDGAIFFAVCRGKVSEGMDFADDNARAVITVGIPFPSIKDLQVKLKREYNDKYRSARGLLSGNEWYEIQAFRALNQALGRCIRHRKDWGAIILVDDRFVRMPGKYAKGLSKWVRNKVRTFEAFPQFLDSVSNFTVKMKKEMPVVNPDTSFIPCTPTSPAARRRSVYQNAPSQTFTSPPMDNSASPYFMNLNGSSPRFIGTPDRILQGRSLLANNKSIVKKQASQTDSVMPTVVATAVPGMSLNAQLLNIMKSPSVPKDKPFCLILNKGCADEQTFHIDPANTAQASKQTDMTAPKPTTSFDPVQPSTSKSILPQPGQTDSPLTTVLATTVPGLPLNSQLFNIINSSAVPKDRPYCLILNKGSPEEQMYHIDPAKSTHTPAQIAAQPAVHSTSSSDSNLHNAQSIKLPIKEEPAKKTLKTFVVSSIPGLPLQDQLKQILGSPSLPKDEAYYIILNQGRPEAQTLLIEPNKDKKQASKMDQAKMEIDSDIDEPRTTVEGNKFLKFCSLSKLAVHTEIVDLTEQETVESHHKQISERTVSPILFEDSIEASSLNDQHMDTSVTHNTVTELHNNSSRKKPIFKKVVKNVRNVQHVKTDVTGDTAELDVNSSGNEVEIEDDICQELFNHNEVKREKTINNKSDESKDDDVTVKKESDVCQELMNHNEVKREKTINNKIDESTEDDVMVEQVESDNNPDGSNRKRKYRGKFDRSIIEKLKPFRRRSVSDTKDTSKEELLNREGGTVLQDLTKEIKDVENHAESDTLSDEEFLCTRRKSGRKRLSTGTSKLAMKRQKGIHYEDKKSKENKIGLQNVLLCAKCGTEILTSSEFESEMDCPKFLKSSCTQKSMNVVQGCTSDITDTSLQCVRLTVNSGAALDSQYIAENQCCVQYLQCGHCSSKNQSVMGARVIMAGSQSPYTVGQTWLISSEVKT